MTGKSVFSFLVVVSKSWTNHCMDIVMTTARILMVNVFLSEIRLQFTNDSYPNARRLPRTIHKARITLPICYHIYADYIFKSLTF